MANPLKNENELYEKIKKEKLTIPAPILDLLEHHLGNNLFAIAAIAGSHVTGDEKEVIPVEDGQKIIKYIEASKKFLNKLIESIKHE